MTRIALALALVASSAAAQPAEVVLGRLCVAESGWRNLEACAAEVYVIRRRAARRGSSAADHARAYSAAWRTHRRPWLFDLADRPRAPRAWPTGPSWARYRPQWRRIVAHVRGALAGDVADPCKADAPDHFGDRYHDAARARRAGWEQVCEHVSRRQLFWRSGR